MRSAFSGGLAASGKGEGEVLRAYRSGLAERDAQAQASE